MKMYLIAILVALIGLWISSEVQADELCGLRSSNVFGVESWKALPDDDGKIIYTVGLISKDTKSIRDVTGTVAFFSGSIEVASAPLVLDRPVGPEARFVLSLRQAEGGGMIGENEPTIQALACVGNIEYSDGSGVIIN